MEPFAVLFDMDGLMLDTERMARIAWTRAIAEKGFSLTDSAYLQLVGRTVADARSILGEIFGSELPFQQVFEMRQAYYDEDIEKNGIPVKPGLMELLDFLEMNRVPKAVATSTPCWFAPRKLAVVGIERRFETIVCGDMVMNGKPAPDLFLEAANQMGFAPRSCVVLEDSEAGILAAHNAGMLPIMIPDLKQPTPEICALAYRVLPTLHEVPPLIEAFLQTGLPLAD